MRTIDADALKADLKQYFTDGVLDGISARLAFNQILHDIDNAPTVERPQGEWLTHRVAFHLTCPFCGCNLRALKDKVFEGDYEYNFCPNCGAKMTKEVENE